MKLSLFEETHRSAIQLSEKWQRGALTTVQREEDLGRAHLTQAEGEAWGGGIEGPSQDSWEDALRRQQAREEEEDRIRAVRALRDEALSSAPFLGFSLAERVTVSSADKRLLSSGAVAHLVVDSLVVDGPAHREGLQLDDRVVSVGGVPSTSLVAVRQAIARGAKVGEPFPVVVRRAVVAGAADPNASLTSDQSSPTTGGAGSSPQLRSSRRLSAESFQLVFSLTVQEKEKKKTIFKIFHYSTQSLFVAIRCL
jgi:hypothetical protein